MASGLILLLVVVGLVFAFGESKPTITKNGEENVRELKAWNEFVGKFEEGYLAEKLRNLAPPNPQYNELNNALSGVIFGPDPGPCPPSDPCTGDPANAPQWVKDIRVEFYLGQERSIGETVKSGNFRLWNFRCSNLAVDDIQVSQGAIFGQSVNGNVYSALPVDVDIDDLRMDCYGNADFRDVNVKIPIPIFPDLNVKLDGTTDIQLSKSGMSGDGNGITVELGTEWYSEDFQVDPPFAMDFKKGNEGRDGCYVDISSGISLPNLRIDQLFGLNLGGVSSFIISIFKGMIEGIICDMISQVAYLKDSGAKGGLNLFVEEVRTDLQDLVNQGLRNRLDYEADEVSNPGTLPNIVIDGSIDFSEDELFEAISVGLNDFLGGLSSEPGYENELVVNEVIDVLNGDTSGVVEIQDIKEFFELTEYPFVEFGDTLTRNTLSLVGFRFRGLNTFTRFVVADNGYADRASFGPAYTFTLSHDLLMDFLDLQFTFDLKMEPGLWVNPSGAQKTIEFRFGAGIVLQQLNIQAATYQLLKFDPLFKLQAGQLFGENQELADAAQCALQAVDHFRFSGLQASAAGIDDPRVVNFFNLANLVESTLDMFNTMFKPTMALQLPYIMENYVRIELNKWLDGTYFTGPPPECPEYVPLTYVDDLAYFNLKNSLALDAVDNLITNLIGGNPVTKNSVDINNLIAGVLRYLIFERAEGAINDDPNSKYTFANPDDGRWKVQESISLDFAVQSDFTKFGVQGPEVRNLNSIWKLLLTPNAVDDYTLDFDLNWGNGYLDLQGGGQEYRGYLQFILPMEIASQINGFQYADEQFEVQLQVALRITGGVRLKVSKNKFYLTKLEDMLELACIFAVLDEKTLDPFSIILEDFTFGFVQVKPFSGSEIGVALADWDTLLRTDPGTIARTDYFINFMIDRIATEFKALVNTDFDPPYDPATCMEAESPLNGTVFGTGIPLPDLDAINKALNDATQFQDNPRGNDPRDWEELIAQDGDPIYDITSERNEYVQALSTAINKESAQNALVDLANTTVNPQYPSILDPLFRMLVLEADDSVTLRLDLNTLTNVNFEPDTDGLIPGLKVRFTEIVVTNLDQFTKLDVLKPYISDQGYPARFTTQNTLAYENKSMFVTFGAELEVSEEIFQASPSPAPILKDVVNVTLELSNVRLETLLSIAVNQTDLSNVQMGEVIFFNETTHAFEIRPDAWNCTLKRIVYDKGMFFQQFQIYVDEVIGPDIQADYNILNQPASDVLNALIRMFVDTFRKQVPNMSQGPMREYINSIFDEVVTEAKKTNTCNGVEIPDLSETGRFLNFSRSALGDDLKFLVSTDLLNENSPLNINSLFNRFVNEFEFSTTTLLNNTEFAYNGLDLGRTTLSFGGFLFEDLGTTEGANVVNMVLLDNEPFGSSQPYTTRSIFDMSGKFQVSFLMTYAFDGLFVDPDNDADDSTKYVRNDLRIGLTLTDVHVLTDMMSRVDIEGVLNLYAGNLLDLYSKPSNVPCLLSIFDYEGLEPEAFEFSVTDLSLTVRCPGLCNSPMFEVLETTGAETGDGVNGDLTAAFNGLINALVAVIGTTDAQQYLNLAISTAKDECRGIPLDIPLVDPEPYYDAAAVMGWAGLGIAGGLVVGAVAMTPLHANRRQELMLAAFGRLNKGDLKEKGDHLLLIEHRLKSLFQHPLVPNYARYGIPFMLGIIIVLFLAANLFTIGVVVEITISFAGDTTKALPLMEFTLASSINDMWNSNTIPLAVIIFIASGFWPHLKSFLLMFSWFCPPTIVPQKKRGGLLHVLDQLGKFSLVDAYVLIMLMVAFRFYISSSAISSLDFLPADLTVIDVAVVPGASIYLFMIATMLALVTNHYMIHLHNKIMELDEILEDRVNGLETPATRKTKQALNKHVFLVPDARNLLYGFNPAVKLMMGSLFVMSTLLILVGSFLPLMTFEFRGVAGIALSTIDPALASNTVSSFSIATSIIDGVPSTNVPARVGVFFLQITYLAFSVITPILLMVMHAVMFYVPLSLEAQKRLYFWTEIVCAWDALIVLIISVLAAILQISDLAIFIVENATGDACSLLTSPLLFLGIPEEDALCFDVVASIEATAAILIAGNLLAMIGSFFAFRLTGAALRDREYQHKGRLDKNGKNPKTHGNFLLRNSVRPVSRIRNGGNQATGQVAPASGMDDDSDSVYAQNPIFQSNIDV